MFWLCRICFFSPLILPVTSSHPIHSVYFFRIAFGIRSPFFSRSPLVIPPLRWPSFYLHLPARMVPSDILSFWQSALCKFIPFFPSFQFLQFFFPREQHFYPYSCDFVGSLRRLAVFFALRCVPFGVCSFSHRQRFAALRSGGILALHLIRRTELKYTQKASNEARNPA